MTAHSRGLWGAQLDDEVEKFRNYWVSKSRDATKLDWSATFRNWIINATKYAKPNGAANDQPANPLARRRGESNFEWVNRCAAYHREHGNLADQEHHGDPVGANDRDVPRAVGS